MLPLQILVLGIPARVLSVHLLTLKKPVESYHIVNGKILSNELSGIFPTSASSLLVYHGKFNLDTLVLKNERLPLQSW